MVLHDIERIKLSCRDVHVKGNLQSVEFSMQVESLFLHDLRNQGGTGRGHDCLQEDLSL